jgi:hypothetical protein
MGPLLASVLADMLGVHVTTATKWVDRVAGNWVNYVASKVSDERQHRRP